MNLFNCQVIFLFLVHFSFGKSWKVSYKEFPSTSHPVSPIVNVLCHLIKTSVVTLLLTNSRLYLDFTNFSTNAHFCSRIQFRVSHPVFLVINVVFGTVRLSQLINQFWCIIINESLGLIHIPLVIPSHPCSVPGSHFIMSPWAPLGCAGFSDFTCLWWLWQFWGALVRYFAGGPSVRVCLMFFSWLDWRLCVWRRKITEGKGGPSHLWTGAHALEPTYHGWSVPWPRAEALHARFLYHCVQYDVEGSHSVQPTLHGPGSYAPPPWGQSMYVKSWKCFCPGGLSMLPHVFISVLPVHQYRLMGISYCGL